MALMVREDEAPAPFGNLTATVTANPQEDDGQETADYVQESVPDLLG
jgi:hypothetical protein